MVERRNMVGGGLAAGIVALMTPERADAAGGAAQREVDTEELTRAVRGVSEAISAGAIAPWRAINRLREQQRLWVRANHRYPDFIEIGIGVWEALYDWHVRYQQPLNMVRTDEGRYVMAFMFTTFILRPDTEPDYVSTPFDAPPPARRP
jgi:hypothetical protein